MSGPIPQPRTSPNVNLKSPPTPTTTATAHASINYVFCRFVTFKGEAIKLPGEYYGERTDEPGIVYTQSHIIRINGHNMDMDMDIDMDMDVDVNVDLLSVSIAHFGT